MLSKTILDLMNYQINREYYSSYLYRAIANYYDHEGLAGFAHWFNVQAAEEKDHAIAMTQYVIDNEARVLFSALEASDENFADFRHPLAHSLEHEQLVTSLIHKIYGQAIQEGDYRTAKFIDFFITEQGEEEKNAGDNLKQFDLFGKSQEGLFNLDAQLGARVYTQIPGLRTLV